MHDAGLLPGLAARAEGQTPPAFEAIAGSKLLDLDELQHLPPAILEEMRLIAKVLPFKSNWYVIDHLIDWADVPYDPMFQLTFPQPGMLSDEQLFRLRRLNDLPSAEASAVISELRRELNPHPAEQMSLNVPSVLGEQLAGMQHKYRETVLIFPAHGQTCHAYCSFCFRWPQFVGEKDLRFAARDEARWLQYLEGQKDVTDVLVTGGDPLVSRTAHLERCLLPLLEPRFDHIKRIRIGTKALTYWPFRFTQGEDADGLIALLSRLVDAGKHVALMTHYNHWRELEPSESLAAIARLRRCGVTLRSQGPLLKHINDDPAVWTRLWTRQVELGIIPYYMFVERDTGPRDYFSVPLRDAWAIYQQAITRVSGLARTVRGPCMSTTQGKAEVLGVSRVDDEEVFVLRFLQARNPSSSYRPFLAKLDRNAVWFDELKPLPWAAEWPAFVR